MIRYAIVWLSVPVAAVVLEVAVNPAFKPLVIVALGFVAALIGALSLFWSIRSFSRRAPLRGFVMLIFPIAFVTAMARGMLAERSSGTMAGFFALYSILRPELHAGDVVRFVLAKPAYDVAIQKLPDDGRRYEEFNWGGWLFASSGVVYDETDEIARPAKRRSAAWVARLRNTDLMCGGTDLVADAEPLWSHYYLAGFGC